MMKVGPSEPEVPTEAARNPQDRVSSLLVAANLAKSFDATQALREFSYEFTPGRVYALVGENGSGKSTLIKLLSGVLPSDRGSVTIAGERLAHFSPRTAMSAGVATCLQEILVEDNLSTLENLFLWDRGWLRPCTRPAARRRDAAVILDELSQNPPPIDWRVEHLSLASRQLVVIARAMLQRDASILLFDEVTAALDQSDSERVLEAMSRRAAEGRAVIFTTHRMEELQRIGEEIIVLRNGEIAGVLSQAELSTARVLELMSGRPARRSASGDVHIADASPPAAIATGTSGCAPPLGRAAQGQPTGVALRVNATKLSASSAPLSLAVTWGEITGLAGLDGHGQADLLKVMGGVWRAVEGTVEVAASAEEAFMPITGQQQAVDLGVTYLPRDRKTQGIFSTLSVLDNFALPTATARARMGFISRRRTVQAYVPLAAHLAIKAASPDAGISSLSGGTQQKVLLARWLAAEPRVVLLDDPTRGVDVGTKLDVYRLLRELAAGGRAVVIVSTELEELTTLCDRIVVLRRGALTADLRRSETAPVERHSILRAMLGHAEETA